MHGHGTPTFIVASASKIRNNSNKVIRPGNPHLVPITLLDARFGDVKINALFDTGSQFSFLARPLAKTIVAAPPITLVGFNSSRGIIDRVSERIIKIGHTKFIHDFVILPGDVELALPCIIGTDFIDKYGIHVLGGDRTISIPSTGEVIPMASRSTCRTVATTLARNPDFTVKAVIDKDYPPPACTNPKLSPADQLRVQQLLTNLSYCFSSRDRPLGLAKGLVHHVKPSGEPFKAKLAALSPKQLATQKVCIDEMLKFGVVVPSSSDWASRPSFAPKPDGSTRFCLNFRKLNQYCEKDNYPLPRAPDLIEPLAKSQYFTKLDAAMGYWQIPIAEEDRKYTAVITQEGLFEFVRMPFGLANAPATFQRFMDQSLKHGLGKFCCVYLDDVLIFSNTFEEHHAHVTTVMQWIANAGLLLKGKKCSFFESETDYLGHIVGNGEMKMTDQKIRKVIDFPPPYNVKEIQSFLGITGYYRKFIKGFSFIAAPLHDLTRKEVLWLWSSECETSFQELKRQFNANVPLKLPNYSREFTIDTDWWVAGQFSS